MSVLDEIVTCDRSAMVIAFPSSKSSFLQSKLTGDFTKRYATYSEYATAVGIDEFAPLFDKLTMKSGLIVKWNSNFDDLYRAVSEKRLVVLFSHYDECRAEIELFGEMIPSAELCRKMPDHWDGFLDASTCFSETLVEDFEAKYKRRAKIGYVRRRLRTKLWLKYYYAFFKALLEQKVPFGQFLGDFDQRLKCAAGQVERRFNIRNEENGGHSK
jgi:hypothetical protein